MNFWRIMVLSFYFFCSAYAQDDSLTAPVCMNPEQIIAKMDGNKIEYVMGEYQLNMGTIKGYLYNDFSSRTYLNKYKALRTTSYLMFAGGLGLVITGFSNGGSKAGTFLTIGGFSVAGTGLVFYFKSNLKFREAIHQYNKSICSNKYHP